MIQKWILESDYEDKFKALAVSKQLKSYSICNNINKEEKIYILKMDITTEVYEGFTDQACSIIKMYKVNGVMQKKTVTF